MVFNISQAELSLAPVSKYMLLHMRLSNEAEAIWIGGAVLPCSRIALSKISFLQVPHLGISLKRKNVRHRCNLTLDTGNPPVLQDSRERLSH